jgi:hypothetical protein
VEHVASMGQMKNAYILVRILKMKVLLGGHI